MFSRFFIDRPIFATVLSVVITLCGGIAYTRLPLTQYPPVAPPTVFVRCTYPGASADVVAQTVAAPIEQQVNGVENMIYMESSSANDGSYSLSVTFRQGVDLNLAQVLVQNRVNLALPMLPDVLKRTGVTTRKMSPDMLMSVNIYSPHGRYDQLYLSNYALMRLRDELLRLPGVSNVNVMGQRDYSMRIWVNPDQLAARSLTAGDVVNAIREQNAQVASGQIGQEPVRPGQETQITLATLGRLDKPEQFADIILRATPDGRITRLRNVGRVVMGARNEDVSCKLDGYPSAGLFIVQLPDANALDVAERVRAKMDELAKDFPDDLKYAIMFDTTPYTSECIDEVFKALRDAVLLVAFVVLLFLQNWRSAVIPLIAVPVAIVGTFGVLLSFGFSLNNLTLFGLVLAIGIVVDDAIVVVEAVEHHIEQGLPPRDATIKAMSQVSGPVIAVGLVLERGLRAVRVYQRADRAVLSPVRPDDRRFDDHLDVQFVDAQPRAVGAAAPRARQGDARGLAAAGVSGARRLAGLCVACAAVRAVAGTSLAAASGRRFAAGSACNRVDCRGSGGRRGRDRRLASRPARRHGIAQNVRVVQRRRRVNHECLHPRGRRLAAGQLDRIVDLCRDAVCDLQVLYDGAEGVHSVAGHGLLVRRGAVARRGVDRTHVCGRGPRAANRHAHEGRQAHDGHRRLGIRPRGVGVELRPAHPDPRRFQ